MKFWLTTHVTDCFPGRKSATTRASNDNLVTFTDLQRAPPWPRSASHGRCAQWRALVCKTVRQRRPNEVASHRTSMPGAPVRPIGRKITSGVLRSAGQRNAGVAGQTYSFSSTITISIHCARLCVSQMLQGVHSDAIEIIARTPQQVREARKRSATRRARRARRLAGKVSFPASTSHFGEGEQCKTKLSLY